MESCGLVLHSDHSWINIWTNGWWMEKLDKVSWLVYWCFGSSRPLRITSGLKETFIKSCIIERTSKAEVRSEEQSENTECCRENLWNKMQLKGP